jgi:hypothetical protein
MVTHMEDEPLLSLPNYGQLSATRYYMLVMYSLLTLVQCLVWFTFGSASSIPDYYSMPNSEVDLLLNWGPIIFLGVVPFASWLLSRNGGLSRALRLGSILCCLACWIRLVPCWYPEQDRRVCSFLPINIVN